MGKKWDAIIRPHYNTFGKPSGGQDGCIFMIIDQSMVYTAILATQQLVFPKQLTSSQEQSIYHRSQTKLDSTQRCFDNYDVSITSYQTELIHSSVIVAEDTCRMSQTLCPNTGTDTVSTINNDVVVIMYTNVTRSWPHSVCGVE